MIPRHGKTHKTALKFTLIPELKFVIIFEGFRAFLLKFSCGLKPAWAGVCNPHPSQEWYPSRLTFASDAVWRCKKNFGRIVFRCLAFFVNLHVNERLLV